MISNILNVAIMSKEEDNFNRHA